VLGFQSIMPYLLSRLDKKWWASWDSNPEFNTRFERAGYAILLEAHWWEIRDSNSATRKNAFTVRRD
jgi:hypothetical protein